MPFPDDPQQDPAAQRRDDRSISIHVWIIGTLLAASLVMQFVGWLRS